MQQLTQWERREAMRQPSGGGGVQGIIMMVVIFAIFYFILIRPQQKKMKEHKKMVDALKKGDEIVTAGGIYGTVERRERPIPLRSRSPKASR